MGLTQTSSAPTAGTNVVASTFGAPVTTDIANIISDKRVFTATDGSTVTFNQNDSAIQQVTLGDNRTLAVSNVESKQVFFVILRQDGTGSRTVTWFSGILWNDGVTPTLETTADKYDVFGFVQVSSGVYLGMVLGQNM